MAYCPKCFAEYRDGFTKCADCDVELKEGQPSAEEIAQAKKDEYDIELEKLVRVNNDIELSYITSMLESEGIAYRTSGGKSEDIYDFSYGKITPMREIFVDKSKMNEAMAIVLSIAGEKAENTD